MHDGKKDHKCDSCGKTFSYSGHLKTHFSSVHNMKKDHKCDLMWKGIFSSRVLEETH